MTGRPRCQLLRRFAPLLAVAALFGPAGALAGTPSPDAPPPAPTGLAPDPAPGSHQTARTPVHAAPVQPATRSAPAVLSAPPTVHTAAPVEHASVAKPKPAKPKPKKSRPHRHAAPEQTRFVVPRIALPASIAAAPGRTLHAVDAVLAGLALLAAAAAAASGARLVAVWNRGKAA